jgi:hypothetical protein
MKVGFYLHILMDTILHQNFCAKSSWINMAYREAVYLPDGSHVEDNYEPYNKNFNDDAPYNKSTVYPAGLEKMGWAVNETFLQLSYQYPTSPKGLGLQSDYDLWNNYSGTNNASYAYDLEAVDNFLKKCMHQTSGASWSNTPQCQRIRQNFACTEHSFDKLKEVWQQQATPMNFDYDAIHVFKKITDPDSSKSDTLEKYSNFFNYTKILYDLQH